VEACGAIIRQVMHYCLSNKGDLFRPRDENEMQLFLKDVLHHDLNIDGSSFICNEFQQDMDWYWEVFKYEHRPLKRIGPEQIDDQDRIVSFRPGNKKYLEEHYNTEVVQSYGCVRVYQLHGKR